jgi:hypothetical protein
MPSDDLVEFADIYGDDDDISFVVEGAKGVTKAKGPASVTKQHRVNSLGDLIGAMRQFKKQAIEKIDDPVEATMGIHLKKQDLVIKIGLVELFSTCETQGIKPSSIKENGDAFVQVLSYVAWDKDKVPPGSLYPPGSIPSGIVEKTLENKVEPVPDPPSPEEDEEEEDRFDLL